MLARFSLRLLALCLLGVALGSRGASASDLEPPFELAPAIGLRARIAPGTLRPDEATLIWNKPASAGPDTVYHVFRDDTEVTSATSTFFTVRQLLPEQDYTFTVKASGPGVAPGLVSLPVSVRTPPSAPVVNILDHGAVGDGITLNTRALQSAINACPPGGVVRIPPGRFLSGALFLKGGMTLQLDAGAVLKGSTNPDDYLPMIRNRFEGWEMDTYASLLNAGTIDRTAPKVRDIAIRGEGTISGGGRPLSDAVISRFPDRTAGLRARGRLILLMNAENVALQGVTLEEPWGWTLHYVYSRDVTVQGLTIRSHVRNGDGIDPDSSINSFIFDTTFDTGDDCIAIKSGKNPEGNRINLPTENVWLAHCRFLGGHGISIGSEMSGGVRNVLVRDSIAGPLLHGLQIKGTRDRGGFVERVVVRDCSLQKISILTQLPYNNDGAPAPTPPVFRDFHFLNLDLSGGKPDSELIVVKGYPEPEHRTRGIVFENLRLPAGAVVSVDQSRDLTFANLTTPDRSPPVFRITASERIAR